MPWIWSNCLCSWKNLCTVCGRVTDRILKIRLSQTSSLLYFFLKFFVIACVSISCFCSSLIDSFIGYSIGIPFLSVKPICCGLYEFTNICDPGQLNYLSKIKKNILEDMKNCFKTFYVKYLWDLLNIWYSKVSSKSSRNSIYNYFSCTWNLTDMTYY